MNDEFPICEEIIRKRNEQHSTTVSHYRKDIAAKRFPSNSEIRKLSREVGARRRRTSCSQDERNESYDMAQAGQGA